MCCSQLSEASLWMSIGDDDDNVLWKKSLEQISEVQLGVTTLLAPKSGVGIGISDKHGHDSICHPKRGDATTMVMDALGESSVFGLRKELSDLHRFKMNGPWGKTLEVHTPIHRFGERLLISVGHGLTSNHKMRKTRSRHAKEARENRGSQSEEDFGYEGPPPWDKSHGGDGIPKFLYDAMVSGALHDPCLARQFYNFPLK